MISDPIRAAVEQLRADLDGLPDYQRQLWEYRTTSVYMNGTSYGSVAAVPHVGPSPVNACTGVVGEHVARLHNVTEALIKLLELLLALARDAPELSEADLRAYVQDTVSGARALAEAITHRSGT